MSPEFFLDDGLDLSICGMRNTKVLTKLSLLKMEY